MIPNSVQDSHRQGNALSIVGLSKTYSNGTQALKDISFNVEEGDFFALLGRNGAGKSTTIGIVCSLITKSAGKVYIFGVDIDKNFGLAKSYMGIVPQQINFNQFETPWNILINHAGFYGVPRSVAKKRAEKYLKILDLWGPHKHTSRALSGGMQRKLMIARALMHKPRMLILDEPTAGVDFETRLTLWENMERLNQEGVTIILTTHYLQEAEKLCRNFGLIDDGEMIINIDMKSLFKRLYQETYLLDLAQPIGAVPKITDLTFRQIDPSTLEVDVVRDSNVNLIFEQFSRHGIQVSSIRNKANRLETLFLELLKTEDEPSNIDEVTS